MINSHFQSIGSEAAITADRGVDHTAANSAWEGQIFAGDWIVSGNFNQHLPSLTLFDPAQPEASVKHNQNAVCTEDQTARPWQLSELQQKPQLALLGKEPVAAYTVDSALSTLETDINSILGGVQMVDPGQGSSRRGSP